MADIVSVTTSADPGTDDPKDLAKLSTAPSIPYGDYDAWLKEYQRPMKARVAQMQAMAGATGTIRIDPLGWHDGLGRWHPPCDPVPIVCGSVVISRAEYDALQGDRLKLLAAQSELRRLQMEVEERA